MGMCFGAPMTEARPRRRMSVVGAATASVLALSGLGACGSSGPERVANQAPDDLVLSVIVGLRRDDAGLATVALERSSPSEATYLDWLTPAEVAAQFGAPATDAATALEVLTTAGFSGGLDPTGGLLVGEMNAADATTFFGTPIVTVPLGASGVLAVPRERPAVPEQLADYATEVVGLTMAIDRDTTTTVAAPADPPPAAPPCPEVLGLGQLLRSHYRLQPLLDAGATGAGVRMAMLEVSPTSQRAIDLFEACRPFEIPPVTVVNADASTPEAFADRAVESTLDIAAAALIAPGLDGIDVYQVNPYAPLAVGLAAVMASANGPDGLPALISLSLGFCEPLVTDAEIAVSERLLMGAAAMGTSVIASTGDFGSSSCAPRDLTEQVQYPASSPWVTGVGGTSLVTTDGTIVDEVAWGENGFGGGGGRTSRIPRPAWQADIPVDGTNRIVPDVAFVANPANLGPIPTCDTAGACVWQVNGGTSATAPGAAAGTALILQYLSDVEQAPVRLGALNPGLYAVARNRAAAGDVSGGYFDIVSGSNDMHQVGCCTATPGYDPATGWGVMDFWDLAQRIEAAIARLRDTD
jgi:subtilase family serine protease